MSEEAFRWIVAGGVFIAALSFLIMAIAAISVAVISAHLKGKIDPILDSARPVASQFNETVQAMRPKIDKITDQALEVSSLVVSEAHRYSDLSKDVAERAKVQVARWDGAVDNTVDNVQEASGAVKEAVLQPIRRIDGFWAGLRTAVATYARGGRQSVNRVTQDEEMFI